MADTTAPAAQTAAQAAASQADAPKKEYHGSCHCGHIKYKINYALPAVPKAGRCNCTICLKSMFTTLHLPAGASDFTLLSPASESEVSDYTYRSNDVHRLFCNKCGVQVWGYGEYPFEGTIHKFFTVNACTLDQPQEGLDLSKFKINYCSGRDDSFKIGEVPFAGGML